MAGVWISEAGRKKLLTDKANGTLTGATVGLFTGTHTPGESDTLSTYTALEAAWTGYARQTISPWGTATTISGNKAQIVSSTMLFTVTSGGTGVSVYGYFVIVGTDWIFAESFAAAVPMTDGVNYSLIVNLTEANA